MPHRWLIRGSGGLGRSLADAIRAQVDVVLGFLYDSSPADELVNGASVLGPLRRALDILTLPLHEGAPPPDRCVVAIGNPVLRQRWQLVLEAVGAHLGVVVHPCACVSPSGQLGPGFSGLIQSSVMSRFRLSPCHRQQRLDVVHHRL